MLISSCDRCGAQFRVMSDGSGIKILGVEKEPTLPAGLDLLNNLVLPLNSQPTLPAKQVVVCLSSLDICHKCVTELIPIVQEWITEKKKTK